MIFRHNLYPFHSLADYFKCVLSLVFSHFVQLVSTEPGKIKVREVSCFCRPACDCYSPKEFILKENAASEEKAEESIEVGQWVLVEYDGDLYPGTVTQL